MKRKILSLVLCLTLLFTTVFTGFTVVSAEEVEAATDNLLVNGNFESYEGTTPTNWQLTTSENATAEIVEDVEIADGVTANAVKFTTTVDDANKRSNLYYTGSVEIVKNAKYTTTFWVKVKNVKGFRTYMYEPNYTSLTGEQTTQAMAQEGKNIYSYTYLATDDDGNPTTRVIRTDVKHEFKIAETGTIIDGTGPSMFISRYNGTEQPLTPDYPNTELQGEWLQVIHTFETGNDEAHEAKIRYQFAVPEAVDGEVWIADVKMTAEKYYVPGVNDDSLGTVTPTSKIPAVNGNAIILTAVPYGENSFVGWYDGDTLVSKDTALTFTYNGNATPEYVAHFEENGFGAAKTFEEGYTNGQTLAQATAVTGTPADAEAGYTTFVDSEIDGSGFLVDSNNTGTWRKATISTDYALSGKYSVKYYGAWGYVGYRYTGLEKNTKYTLSVWAYCVTSPVGNEANINYLMVTPGNASYRDTTKRLAQNYTKETSGASAQITSGWTKLQVTADTGDNTELILWIDSSSDFSPSLYLDNFAIARQTLEYTPNVNDKALGYASTVTTRVGSKTTVVATPMGEATFDGWYNGDTLLSKDAEYTFVYTAEAANYEARFIGSGFGIDGGYESYSNGQRLAQEISYTKDTYTEDLFLTSTQDGGDHYISAAFTGNNWRNASVTNAMAYSGKQSLKLSAQYGFVGRKLTGLTPNTDYIVSFYAYLTHTKDASPAGLGGLMVTDTATSAAIMKDGTVKERAATDSGVLFKEDILRTEVIDKWAKLSIAFNSGENEEVIFWMSPKGTNAVAYIDNLAITRTAEIEVESSIYGTTDIVGTNTVGYNEAVTVTATPLEGNTFDGWYVEGELVSADAIYTFTAVDGMVLTPKFSGTTYEHFSANGKDGTFENGTAEEWAITFADPNWGADWCNVRFSNSAADSYQGSNSLRIDARHRNTIIPLTGLDKNTNYTISFMYKLSEVEAANSETGDVKKTQLSSAGIVTSDITHIGADTETLAKVGPVDSTADWQKVELSFNTGNNTELNLVVRFATESINPMFLDNLTLMHKDTVAPESVAGDINGNGEADLTDVTALSQYLAGWTVDVNEEALDVNGDTAVNLKDLVLLAQFVAGWDVILP